jgi:hypothetical protein
LATIGLLPALIRGKKMTSLAVVIADRWPAALRVDSRGC